MNLDVLPDPASRGDERADIGATTLAQITPAHSDSRTINSIADVLAQGHLLSREALARAQLVAQESGERLEAVVTRLGLMSEQALCDHLAAATGMALADADSLREPMPLDRSIAAEFLRDIRRRAAGP